LTEEEYISQGVEETRKALEELRRYCRSPECNAWKTVSRLSSPAQQLVLQLFIYTHDHPHAQLLFNW